MPNNENQGQEPKLENTNTNKQVVIAGASSSNQIATLAGDIFKGVDFSGLNSAIDAIAGKAGELNKEEKEAALEIIEQWNSGIISRLHEKNREMSQFLNFFEAGSNRYGSSEYDDMLEDMGNILAAKTNTVAEYDAYIEAREKLNAHRQTRPDQPEPDEYASHVDIVKKTAQYETDMKIYELALQRLSRAERTAEIAWKKLLRENKDVKELMKQARKYNNNLGKVQNECKEKTQLAKLNVSIQSESVRDSLREMVNFTKTL